jgi:hypothetical protein
MNRKQTEHDLGSSATRVERWHDWLRVSEFDRVTKGAVMQLHDVYPRIWPEGRKTKTILNRMSQVPSRYLNQSVNAVHSAPILHIGSSGMHYTTNPR